MGEYTIKALTNETWEAFATLCAKNNGGGMGVCGCTWFHREKHSAPGSSTSRTSQETRDDKQHRVDTDYADAALVSDGDMVVSRRSIRKKSRPMDLLRQRRPSTKMPISLVEHGGWADPMLNDGAEIFHSPRQEHSL